MNLQLEGNKLIYHLDRLYDWHLGKNIYPLYLEIGPASSCNQNCIHCYINHVGFKNSLLKEDIFLKLIDDVARVGVKGIQFAGCGEPLLNRALPKVIQKAHDKNISIALTTNGVLYNKSIIEETFKAITWVRISILGGSPDTYSLLHRVPPKQFDMMIQNIKDAVKIKKKNAYKTTIGVAMFLFRENAFEIVNTARLMEEIGVDYFVVKCPGYDPRNEYKPERGLEVIFEKELKEVEKTNGKNFIAKVRWDQFKSENNKPKIPKGCLSLDFMTTINSDGKVYPCNGRWDNQSYCYGSLYENTFIEIWNSQKRKKITEKLKKNGDHKNCYCICRNYSVNNFLWNLVHPPDHVNLI